MYFCEQLFNLFLGTPKIDHLLKLRTINFVVILSLLMAYQSYAQEVYIQAKSEPLSQLLKRLNESYGIQFSFNARLLHNCLITVDKTFESPSKTLDYLTEECNCQYKSINGVFAIIAKRSLPKKEFISTRRYSYQGQIIDIDNREPLPFASVQINQTNIITDAEGNFSYYSRDSIARLVVTHLGYFAVDTPITARRHLKIGLYPTIAELQEITVLSTQKLKIINPESKAGLSKLNNTETPFLPGSTNNSLFSFLRLQSGVLASGEQTKDYILWGSYKGQTHVLFDDITIFNTSSYNDQIGTINPFFIKDIEILKGGYNVDIGDRVGGVVSLTSKTGQTDTSLYHITGTERLFNGYANIGLNSRSNLQVGGRLVFSNLLQFSLGITPIYAFGDLTGKYSYQFDNGDVFKITMLGDLDYSDIHKNIEVDSSVSEGFNFQQKRISTLMGGSMVYTRKWKKIGITTGQLIYSQFQSEYNTGISTLDSTTNIFSEKVANGISELTVRVKHSLPAFRHHNLSGCLYFIYNRSNIKHNFIRDFRNLAEHGPRLGMYIKDEISWWKFLVLRPGIRLDLPLRVKTRPFIQPRIEALFIPSRQWKINLAYGLYHQFISENALVDALRNYTYHWSVADGDSIPVPVAMHYVAGISCQYQYWSCKVEGYYKDTRNILQFGGKQGTGELDRLIGRGTSYGLDIKFAAHFKNQRIWAAYTFSRANEQFGSLAMTRAPHDQRHEFKIAGMFNIKSFFFSINYVYGSGFPNTKNLFSQQNTISYSRLDVGFLYKLRLRKLDIDFGLSILNLLNRPNVRYNNFVNFPDNTSEYLQGTSFSPTLFMNFNF